MDAMEHFDVCIAGAGIVGLSLALELRRRGQTVVVLERGKAMAESSWAAAGMLAAHDPENPPALAALAELSVSMYPGFLDRIRSLSGLPVPIRTRQTLQKSTVRSSMQCAAQRVQRGDALRRMEPALADLNLLEHLPESGDSWFLLDEWSVDPRDLCGALPAASNCTGVVMRENCEWLPSARAAEPGSDGNLEIATPRGNLETSALVDCRGAWASAAAYMPILRPVKGQALTVAVPPGISISRTIRAPEIYLVPRGDGRVLIGATVEEAGFDKSTSDKAVNALMACADKLVPGIVRAAVLQTWAGLRPGTPDGLPLLGAVPGTNGHFIASGHYRNGILLAPATALVMAQLICGETPSIDLSPFSPARFRRPEASSSSGAFDPALTSNQ